MELSRVVFKYKIIAISFIKHIIFSYFELQVNGNNGIDYIKLLIILQLCVSIYP